MKYLLILIVMLFAGAPVRAEKPMLEFRLGLDYLALEQSDIRGLNSISLFYTTPQGFYGGTSLYSAAFGTGGGFFVGGWEAGKRTALGDRFYWDASLFIGGGGGASQVTGDGLMLRPQVHLGYDFGGLRIGAGVSGVSISGSEISTPAFTLTLTRPLDLELVSGHPQAGGLSGATRIKALTPMVRNYVPLHSNKRGGSVLNPMQLLGAELTFGNTLTARASFRQAVLCTVMRKATPTGFSDRGICGK